MNEIGELLYKRRKELGLTLEEVGDAVGVGKSTVRKWEKGIIKNMGRDKLSKIASVLRIDPVLLVPSEEELGYEFHFDADPFPYQEPLTVEARILAKRIDKLNPEERARALAVVEAMFAQHPELFND